MRQLLFTVTALGLLFAPAAANQIIIGEQDGKDIVTVRATEATQSKQALTIFTRDFGQYRPGEGSLFVEGRLFRQEVRRSSCAQGL